MDVTVRTSFRRMRPSPALQKEISERIEWLARCCSSLTSCQVAIEAPCRAYRNVLGYRVKVVCTTPGHRFCATQNIDHGEARVAISKAFRAIRRELKDEMKKPISRDTITTYLI